MTKLTKSNVSIGGRVMAIGDVDSLNMKGMVGTIICIDGNQIVVEFDLPVPASSGHSCNGRVPSGNGWWGKIREFRNLGGLSFNDQISNMLDRLYSKQKG